jgi:hypothetical protein
VTVEDASAAMWAALLAIQAHNQSTSVKFAFAAFPAMGTGFGQFLSCRLHSVSSFHRGIPAAYGPKGRFCQPRPKAPKAWETFRNGICGLKGRF